MNLTIFSCSTGFHSYPTPNKSYVERLSSEYPAKGRWMDGLSILDVKRELPLFVYGNDRAVILHIGAVEAFSYPAANIIEWCAEYFLRNPFDPYAITFLIPKIIEASHALTHKQELFLPVLESSEFEFILHQTLHLLQGSNVIIVGMNKPNTPGKSFWIEQALTFNQILEEEAKTFNSIFVNSWNLCPHCVTDNNHLNEEGHNILYEKIRGYLND
jgi:hypothetical protein